MSNQEEANMITHALSTGHTATLDLDGLTLTLAGPIETMQSVPDSELSSILSPHGLVISDVLDEVTYALVHARQLKYRRVWARASYEWGLIVEGEGDTGHTVVCGSEGEAEDWARGVIDGGDWGCDDGEVDVRFWLTRDGERTSRTYHHTVDPS